MTRRSNPFVLALALFTFGAGNLPSISAQCLPTWRATGTIPGVDGTVHALATFDPDGTGPEPAVLILGGDFTFAGDVQADHIVQFDPVTGRFSRLAGSRGMDRPVRALVTMPNGDLVAGGPFGGAYGTLAQRVARWNGSSWAPLGAGLVGDCHALCALPNGDLIATGNFSSAGGQPANAIARWDGTSWFPLGSGLGGGFPIGRALLQLPNGDLVVAGEFSSAGGVPSTNVARWDGSQWHALPTPSTRPITHLALAPTGELVAISSDVLARFDGTSWYSLGTFTPPFPRPVFQALGQAANGELLVSGVFDEIDGTRTHGFARWDGTTWSAAAGRSSGTPSGSTAGTQAIQELQGRTYLGGSFRVVDSMPATGIAYWEGSQWSALADGLGGIATTSTLTNDGRLVVATTSTRTPGAARTIVRRDGARWTVLGEPLGDAVYALTTMRDGTLVAGGLFSYFANGTYQSGLAVWSGTRWESFPVPLRNGSSRVTVSALLTLPNGDLLAAGEFEVAGSSEPWNVARWDGSSWTGLGGVRGVGLTPPAIDLVALPNGDVIAHGEMTSIANVSVNHIARWNGSTWTSLGAGIPLIPGQLPPVRAVTSLPDGSLIAGGVFASPATNVARFDGSTWSPLGNGIDGRVEHLLTLPGGDVIAAGSFGHAGGTTATNLARWNGTSWSALDGGVDGPVTCLAFPLAGELFVSGTFTHAGGRLSPYVADLASPCPATATPYGQGCAGATGELTLVARTLPWAASSYRVRATGYEPSGLGFALLGIDPLSLPLASLEPTAGPGCALLVDPVIAEFVTADPNGEIHAALALPNDPSFVGSSVSQQFLEVRLSGTNVGYVGSSNGLTATFGVY